MSRKSDECLNDIESSRNQLEEIISDLENELEESINTNQELRKEIIELNSVILSLESNQTE